MSDDPARRCAADSKAAFDTVATRPNEGPASDTGSRPAAITSNDDLVDRTWQETARHWTAHQRPTSAETLRKNLHQHSTLTDARLDHPSRMVQRPHPAHVVAVGHSTSE